MSIEVPLENLGGARGRVSGPAFVFEAIYVLDGDAEHAPAPGRNDRRRRSGTFVDRLRHDSQALRRLGDGQGRGWLGIGRRRFCEAGSRLTVTQHGGRAGWRRRPCRRRCAQGIRRRGR